VEEKDEEFANPQIPRMLTLIKSQEEEGELEWDNESQSDSADSMHDGNGRRMDDDAIDDDAPSYAASEKDTDQKGLESLDTFEQDFPLDDTLETLDTIEEEDEYPMDEYFMDNHPRLGSTPKQQVLPSPKPQASFTTNTIIPPSTKAPPPILRNGTLESIPASLESMDSLAESHWDPDDDASNATPLVKNTHTPNDAFFIEHVKFLQVQTQPRKVEQVYDESRNEVDHVLDRRA